MAASLEDLSKTLTEMQSNLVCKVCEDRARPEKKQWYRCFNLHQICQDCKEKFDLCTCGQLISTEHCKMTEQLLGTRGLRFSCIHSKNGCKETLDENALMDHESECLFRLVSCPFYLADNCETRKVIFRDFIQHYEEGHTKLELKNTLDKVELTFNKHGVSGRDCLYTPNKFCVNNQIFLFCGKHQNSIVYRWLYLHGSPNEAKHFSYTLKFESPKATTTFEGKVATIDEDFHTLSKAGKCFAIPHQLFMDQFVDENQKFEYSLEIRNLKEEVKDENYESGISDEDEDSKEIQETCEKLSNCY